MSERCRRPSWNAPNVLRQLSLFHSQPPIEDEKVFWRKWETGGMRREIQACLIGASIMMATGNLPSALASSDTASVREYQGGPERSGRYLMRGLDADKVASTVLDADFDGRIAGRIIAQPLYWRHRARGIIIVASEANVVSALDAQSGKAIWTRSLGAVAWPRIPCGKIGPIGLHGTPVIDQERQALYLDTVIDDRGLPRHMIFALSLDDGSVLPGWPLRVADGLRRLGVNFDDSIQEEYGALTLMGERLYVAFGGYGDCGPYHGRVVEVDTRHAAITASWSTRGLKGGIWAPGGVLCDGRAVMFATGNTSGAREWADGESIFRLNPGLSRGDEVSQSFTPTNWKELDAKDEDLGGTAPTIIDMPHGPHPHLLLGLGKNGKAYLLDRNRLGGIGGSLAEMQASDRPILSATATYEDGEDAIVIVQAHSPSCANDDGLLALRIAGGEHPSVQQAWCAALTGRGAPILTISDAKARPIVWTVGAAGDNRLHAFLADTGDEIYSSSPLPPMRRYTSIVAVDAEHRLYVAAGNRVLSFTFGRWPDR